MKIETPHTIYSIHNIHIFDKSYCFCCGDDSVVRFFVLTKKSLLLILKVIKEKIELYFFHFTADSCFGLNICPFSKYPLENIQIDNDCDNDNIIQYYLVNIVDYHIKYEGNLLLSHSSSGVYLLLN